MSFGLIILIVCVFYRACVTIVSLLSLDGYDDKAHSSAYEFAILFMYGVAKFIMWMF